MLRKPFQDTYDIAAEQRRHPTRFSLARALGRPMYLRQDRQPGWSGNLPIYVRWCAKCERYSVSHPAGYAERIHCGRCRESQTVMTWTRFRQQVLPIVLPATLICAAYAIFRLWWVSRSG